MNKISSILEVLIDCTLMKNSNFQDVEDEFLVYSLLSKYYSILYPKNSFQLLKIKVNNKNLKIEFILLSFRCVDRL